MEVFKGNGMWEGEFKELEYCLRGDRHLIVG